MRKGSDTKSLPTKVTTEHSGKQTTDNFCLGDGVERSLAGEKVTEKVMGKIERAVTLVML